MVNIDELARIIQREHCPNMKIKDIKKVLMSSLDAVTDLLADGVTVKLHKTMKLEPVRTDACKSFDGINKRYYDRPARTHVKLTELSMLEQALKDNGKTY